MTNMNKSKKSIEGLNITPEEVKSFSEALKNEEFRKLFFDYAQELNGSANPKKQQPELIVKDSEHEVDTNVFDPKPAFVLEMSANGVGKCYIDVLRCTKVDKPKSSIEQQGATRGLRWQIPHSSTSPRADMNKSGERCTVYSVLFHPDTIRMAETNDRFSKMVQDLACDTVEKQFKLKLDRTSLKKLQRVDYMGDTAVRKARNGVGKQESASDTNCTPKTHNCKSAEPPAHVAVANGHGLPQDENGHTNDAVTPGDGETTLSAESAVTVTHENSMEVESDGDTRTTPHYSVKYRYDAHPERLTGPGARAVAAANRPNAIDVRVDLPLINAASEIDVDVFERRLELRSDHYRLNLRFSYEVVADDASARFEKKTHTLTVSVPVRKQSAAKPHIEELAGATLSEDGAGAGAVQSQPTTDDALRETDANVDVCETQLVTTEREAEVDVGESQPESVDFSIGDLSNNEERTSVSSDDSDARPVPRQHSSSFSTDSLPDATLNASASQSHLQSILKVHSMPDGCCIDEEQVTTFRRRRVSKSVSFSETLQIETPDYRKPVATAFRKAPPNALTRREKRAMKKRNRQPSGSDSNGETSSCERAAASAKRSGDTSGDEVDMKQTEDADVGDASPAADADGVGAAEQSTDAPGETAAAKVEDENMQSSDDPTVTVTATVTTTEVGEAKKKRKRNKRKKQVSGDHRN